MFVNKHSKMFVDKQFAIKNPPLTGGIRNL